MSRKAAIEMSLGFIVAVVFAVVLLGLALVWLNDIFGQFQQIAHQTTDIAKNELMQKLVSEGKKVGIAAPATTKWKRGETGSYALGINNKESGERLFYVNVYLETVNNVDGDLNSLNELVKKWITLSPTTIRLKQNERGTINIIIKPDKTEAQSGGMYSFRACVCTATKGEGCHEISPGLYDSAPSDLYGSESFSIEII